jgi:hypothetical protein
LGEAAGRSVSLFRTALICLLYCTPNMVYLAAVRGSG